MLHDHAKVFNVRIRIIQVEEGKQYLTPTVNEVVGLIVGDGTKNLGSKDVIIQKRDGTMQRINKTHPSSMTLQHPLLISYDIDGWS